MCEPGVDTFTDWWAHNNGYIALYLYAIYSMKIQHVIPMSVYITPSNIYKCNFFTPICISFIKNDNKKVRTPLLSVTCSQAQQTFKKVV